MTKARLDYVAAVLMLGALAIVGMYVGWTPFPSALCVPSAIQGCP